MPQKITTEFLKLYLKGECSPEEKLEMETFLLLPEGEAMLKNVLDESWEELKKTESNENPEHFKVFKEKYQLEEQAVVKKSSTLRRELLKYAALLLCLFSLGIVLNRTSLSFFKKQEHAMVSEKFEKHSNPRGQTSIITLPDSSKVYLGAESSIRFSEKFEGKKREIYLVGEAFFDVVHLQNRPFVVNTGSVQTVVLGTSFKIDAHIGKNISVSVATGKVGVGNNSRNKYKSFSMLYPGEKLTWNPVKKELHKEAIEVTSLWTWKNGGLVIRNESLEDIAQTLERTFDVHIDLDKSLSEKRLSASFGRTSITEILNVLAYTGKFTYTLKDNYVKIKKKPGRQKAH